MATAYLYCALPVAGRRASSKRSTSKGRAAPSRTRQPRTRDADRTRGHEVLVNARTSVVAIGLVHVDVDVVPERLALRVSRERSRNCTVGPRGTGRG